MIAGIILVIVCGLLLTAIIAYWAYISFDSFMDFLLPTLVALFILVLLYGLFCGLYIIGVIHE